MDPAVTGHGPWESSLFLVRIALPPHFLVAQRTYRLHASTATSNGVILKAVCAKPTVKRRPLSVRAQSAMRHHDAWHPTTAPMHPHPTPSAPACPAASSRQSPH